MLMDRTDVLELLRCPQSGEALTLVKDELHAVTADTRYRTIEGIPILFSNTNSGFSADGVSQVARPDHSSLPRRLVQKYLFPVSSRTRENVTTLIEHCTTTQPSKVLVVGGGELGDGMGPLYDDPNIDVVAFDVYATQYVQFVADGHEMPLPRDCFDAVVVQAVLEHVIAPERVVAEIQRVLKPGGMVYAETPFMQQVHEGPYDFTRFTESGHRYLFRRFSLEASGFVSGCGSQALWSLEHLVRGLTRSKKAGKAVRLLCFWLHWLDRVIPDEYNIDGACGVYFLGRKTEVEIGFTDIVAHYAGAQ